MDDDAKRRLVDWVNRKMVSPTGEYPREWAKEVRKAVAEIRSGQWLWQRGVAVAATTKL